MDCPPENITSTSISGTRLQNRYRSRSPRAEEARRETMISKSNLAFRVATFALLAAALGACTKSQQSDAQSTAAPVSQPTAAQPAAATAQPQSAATAAPASNAGIANTEGDKPGTRLVLNSLARGSGDTLTLRFTVVNNSDASLNMYATFHGSGYGGSGYDVAGVNLMHPRGKRKN